jgi:hypothetical protein
MRPTCLAYGGFAYGGEPFPIFRASEESLDRRQLSDSPFHCTPDTRCLRRDRSLYNARRERAVYRSFKTQAFEWFSSAAISYPTNHAPPLPFQSGRARNQGKSDFACRWHQCCDQGEYNFDASLSCATFSRAMPTKYKVGPPDPKYKTLPKKPRHSIGDRFLGVY